MRIHLKQIFLIGNVMCLYIIVIIFLKKNEIIDINTINKETISIENQIIDNHLSCQRVELELWPQFIEDYYKNYSALPLNCSKNHDWFYIKNGKLIQNQNILISDINCDAKPILRLDDFYQVLRQTSRNLKNGSKIPSDFFLLKCTGKKYGAVLKFRKYFSGIKRKEKLIKMKNTNEKQLWNVLMFGFDSVSRMQWIRLLPKSHKYWTEDLKATVFEGYNIVGDGTPQALLPILTGKTEEELPEARRGHKEAEQVDHFPWIWKEFSKNNYVTQWGEDGQTFGTFQNRMLGFKDPPTDYYLRPFQLSINQKNKCMGDVPTHKVMTDWIDELWRTYKNDPKFSFLFHSLYSHEHTTQISVADNDLLNWLKLLNNNGVFENTFVFLMADHGPRFTDLRSNIQGKYEERNPYFSLKIPNLFAKQYPEVLKNVRKNFNRLVTPFDIHGTFMDIINFEIDSSNDIQNRELSLLKTIPATRNCSNAFIEPHWCSCLNWEKIKTNDLLVIKSAKKVVDLFNNITFKYTNNCAKLKLSKIHKAEKYQHDNAVLKFKKSSDNDGRIADLSDDMTVEDLHLRIEFETLPNVGLYESSVKILVKDMEIVTDFKQTSRINRYGNQPGWVGEKWPELRSICLAI